MNLYAEVILSLPVSQTFSYIIPQSLRHKVKIGSRVLVPFAQRTLTGFIIGLKKRRSYPEIEFKEIMELLDEEPIFTSSFLTFTRKLSDYYYSAWGEILQASLPPSFILKSKITVHLLEKGKDALQKESLSKEERELLRLLSASPYSLSFLKRKLRDKSMASVISRLEKKGWILIQKEIKKAKQKSIPETARIPTQLEMDFALDTSSLRAAEKIASKTGKDAFSLFFLLGSPVKRESVYFFLIKKTLEARKRVLLLVPEISLTQDLIAKFEKRLGERAALLHSRLSERRREFEWLKIKKEEVDVVVGPRSALFSPLENLGLVIVDEEQDDSYYQQENPCYDARRGALLRAKQDGAVLVYGSSSPSVSSLFRAKKRGHVFCLESEAKRGKVEIMEDRGEKRVISDRLDSKIQGRLRKKEPVLIFLNRRGYASSLFCPQCNFIPRCLRCDISLTYHKRKGELVCHYCNDSLPRMDSCPECGSRLMKERGVGIEAVEEELKKTFPSARVFCLTADQSRNEQERTMNNFQKGKIDILAGTQLLARQPDLPSVDLVAILYPETILTLSDYRASQKTYQAISQMLRYLKNDEKAEAVIHTALPHHFSIRLAAAQDYATFFNLELKFRRLMNYPPFSHIVEILFQGENLRRVANQSREFLKRVRECSKDIEILGPALAPVAKVRGMNRVQVVLKARRKRELDDVLKKMLPTFKMRKSVRTYD